MTKHASEDTFKFHLTVEEPKKLVEENTVCNVPVRTELERKFKVSEIKAEPEINTMGTVMPELYNLEEHADSEKPVKISLDLDLYQMEKV